GYGRRAIGSRGSGRRRPEFGAGGTPHRRPGVRGRAMGTTRRGRSAGDRPFLGAGLLVLLDRLLQQADDQGVERGLVLLRPARQLLVQGWWHPDLEMDDGLGHRW